MEFEGKQSAVAWEAQWHCVGKDITLKGQCIGIVYSREAI